MTVKPIRVLGDPALRIACQEVGSFDEGLAALIEDLVDTVMLPGRAGLAAPQIGVTRRVFSYDVDGVLGYVVNPVLIRTEGEQDGPEGCLSIPGVWIDTPRAQRAVVAGFDLEGRPVEVEGSGLMARCLQHETDHLDGRLYVDRLDRDRRREAMRAIRQWQVSGTGRSDPDAGL